MQRKQSSHFFWGDKMMCSLCGKGFWKLLKNLMQNHYVKQQFCFWVYTENLKQRLKYIYAPMFSTVLFLLDKTHTHTKKNISPFMDE